MAENQARECQSRNKKKKKWMGWAEEANRCYFILQ